MLLPGGKKWSLESVMRLMPMYILTGIRPFITAPWAIFEYFIKKIKYDEMI